jgi:hypothetical protein
MLSLVFEGIQLEDAFYAYSIMTAYSIIGYICWYNFLIEDVNLKINCAPSPTKTALHHWLSEQRSWSGNYELIWSQR